MNLKDTLDPQASFLLFSGKIEQSLSLKHISFAYHFRNRASCKKSFDIYYSIRFEMEPGTPTQSDLRKGGIQLEPSRKLLVLDI